VRAHLLIDLSASRGPIGACRPSVGRQALKYLPRRAFLPLSHSLVRTPLSLSPLHRCLPHRRASSIRNGCTRILHPSLSHMPASLYFASSKEMLRCAETHVASVHFKCCGCFRSMLQLFQMNVAYVAMVVHVSCKGLFLMFHLCFWTYCCKCVYGCCIRFKCFIYTLRMFAMVFKCLYMFLQVV
jgi:hypothetical protein